jgi:hypothetical protein
VTYVATNVIQPVSITLTVYGEKTGTLSASLKSADVLASVEKAITTTNTFDKKAELVLATSSIVTQVSTTNVVTNVPTTVPNTLSLTTNTVLLTNNVGQTNTITIGNPAGDTVTIGSNITVVTAGPLGPTTNTYALTNVTVSDNTVTVGTNAAITVQDSSVSGAITSVDTNTISTVTYTNGVPTATNSLGVLGTNAISIATATNGVTTVVIGGVTNSYTNAGGTNIGIDFGTNIIVGATNAPGLGATNALSTIATTTFSNAAPGGTNTVTYISTITDNSTGSVLVTNVVPVFGTNLSSELAIADSGINTPIPSSVLSITAVTTNSVSSSTKTSTTSYSVKSLTLNATNSPALTLKLQGLVKSATASVTLAKDNVVSVTNETWADVSGYGTNGTSPIVGGGTITISAPVKQLVP